MNLRYRNRSVLWVLLFLLLAAWAAATFVFHLLSFSPRYPAAIIGFCVGCMFRLEINSKLQYVLKAILCIALACLLLYSMQSIASRHFADEHDPLTPAVYVLNLLCILSVQCFFLVVTANFHAASYLTTGIFIVYLTATYFVLRFRNRELIFSDFAAFGAAMNVLSNYQMPDFMPLLRRIIYPIAFCFALSRLRLPRNEHRLHCRSVAFALGFLFCFVVAFSAKNYAPLYWTCEGAIINGMPFNFYLTARDASASKPEGYSTDTIDALAEQYVNETVSANTILPDIIVIMNESFADLQTLGAFETNIETLPHLRKMQRFAITGNMLTPAFGGNTVMPEWEFLTGNTTAFSSEYCNPFQLYVDEPSFSVVHWMNNLGYMTVGLHPYAASGWSRDTAYHRLGFQRTVFLPDFPQKQYVRKYISDQEVYDMLLSELASAGERPAFLFTVTMQNHGGYTIPYSEGEQVYPLDDTLAKTDICNYLTLAQETDRATAELLEALEKRDRPTYVLFFGDHQPLLSDSFYSEVITESDPLERRVKQHITPFFLWSNQGIDACNIPITSANYLAPILLNAADVPLPAYFSYLLELRETLPAFTAFACWSNENDKYISPDALTNTESNALLAYEQLMYNSIFDKKHQNERFFGIDD